MEPLNPNQQGSIRVNKCDNSHKFYEVKEFLNEEVKLMVEISTIVKNR